ncbi:MAG: AAA family ATPase, partial [Dehalococcoidia bacterium]
MRLVRSVQIEGFRSLNRVKLEELSDFVALVGPNNSGKSNILRALNLFFNEEIDHDSYLDFDIDSHLSRANRRKRITVAVEFDLPPQFKLTSAPEALAQELGRRFFIKKIWTREAPYDPSIETSIDGLSYEVAGPERRQKAQMLLNLISFRYVPNRAVPAILIRNEWGAVQAELARRVGKKGEFPHEVLKTRAKSMIQPFVDDIKDSLQVSDLELVTPTDLKDLVFSSIGLRVPIGRGAAIEDTALGSGAQGILMFCMLHLIDRSRFRRFGWNKAAFWAIEEPESSLHRDLQLKAAWLLRSYSRPDSRFQLLITTHNEVFVESADSGFSVTLDANRPQTSVKRSLVRDLAEQAANDLVCGWTPAVLKNPHDRLVLVEGPTDSRILERASQLTATAIGTRFCTVPQLDSDFRSGGYEQIIAFLRKHSRFLPSRLPRYPLLVLLDWDCGDDKVNEAERRYGSTGNGRVARMQEDWCATEIDQSVHGVERMLSCRVLEMALARGAKGIEKTVSGRFVVYNRGQFQESKDLVATVFCQEATPADCRSL